MSKKIENSKNPVICVVYDSVADKFGSPSTFINKNVAVRSFVDLLNTPSYKEHKSDYSLYYVAFYDESTGTISDINKHELLIKGSDVIDFAK